MTLVPVSGSAGVETATVTASDGSLSVQQNITFVTTTASGDVTVANPIGNLSLDEDFGTSSIDLSSVFSYSADANASFTYSLSGNNNLGASMNGQTLELTSPVDFNGTDALFIVGTTDGKSSFTNFTITVNAVNDAPTLQNSLTDETAPEDASFSKVISASAFTDIDGDALTYTASFTAGWLSFDASTRTFSGTPTNADVGTVAVTLTAKDPSGVTATDSFDLTVTNTNDNPTDITTAATAIDENVAVGTTVTTLTSIDPDVGDDSFTYALVAGTGGKDNDMFEISGNTLKTKAGVDFESKASYSIRVQTTDGFEGSYSEVLTITVNNVNEAVTGVSLDKLTIDENKSSGTAVGTLSSSDLDNNDSFTYGLVSGTGDTDNAQFTIADGALNTAEAFDFETKTSYSIRVKSTDAGGLSFEQVMTISVNNVNEVATAFTAVSTSIDENEPSGMTLGGFTVTDPDASDTHTYAMVAGEGDEDNASFKISGSKLATAAVLDFETKSSYSVRVSATDAGGLSIENTFTITLNDINEAATDLLLDNQSIPENTAIGTAIGAFTAVDQDAGDTHTFGLVAGEGDTDNASFEISSGNLVTKSALDFETQNSYSVRVETADAGGLTYWKVFTITVSDVGEATIETSSQSLAFELTEVGKTAELSFEISNNGDGVLAVSGIVLPTGYTADWTSGEVAASASQTVKVTFTPTDAVVYAGQINVESNAGDIVIEVTGEGQVVTGIDDDPRYAALVEVYPNPTTDRVTIDLSQLNWIKPTVMIRNSSGNLILSKDEVQDQRLELDVRSYAQGVYLIQIISESRLVFKKVVIRR